MEAFCRNLDISFHFERTDYGVQAHGPENRENPCFLCARLRRRRLFEMAHSLQCAKLAFGHNQDDIIETFFLNILFKGEIGTMVPRQVLFRGALTLIRPLALLGRAGDPRVGATEGLAGNREYLSQRRAIFPGTGQKNAGGAVCPQPENQGQCV